MAPTQHPPQTAPGAPEPTVEMLSADVCLGLLRAADVGRLAMWHEDHGLDVFPINFVVDRGSLVFRTHHGTKTQLIHEHATTAIEADARDDELGTAWSVVAKGPCHLIERLDEMVDTFDLPVDPWLPEDKHLLVRLEPIEISGRRFHRPPRPSAVHGA